MIDRQKKSTKTKRFCTVLVIRRREWRMKLGTYSYQLAGRSQESYIHPQSSVFLIFFFPFFLFSNITLDLYVCTLITRLQELKVMVALLRKPKLRLP